MSGHHSPFRLSVVTMGASAFLIGCSLFGGRNLDNTGGRTSESAERPVDANLAAVSRSKPEADAQAALDACNVTKDRLDTIAGMARVEKARDVQRYVVLTGREPNLKSDSPTWVIQFRGEIYMPREAQTWIAPICVMVEGGDSGYFATGDVIMLDGKRVSPEPGPVSPSLALPSLAP